ncbi:MAG TPA: ferritin-like domain-containing protein [Myxococcota bacterium]|nr:ferritin-like domain-containing protein [Myxococcota bacterium]
MEEFDLDAYTARSRALDLSGIDFDRVPETPLAPEALRTLSYMQDIESHTIVYLRQLLATRVIDEPEVATFLSCWIYEETFHGRALDRFLAAAGHRVSRPKPRSKTGLGGWLEERTTALLSRAWRNFVAVHMTWGALNELTTLTGYRRLAALANHPVLSELLARIVCDESRHFSFYFKQAERRLGTPGAAQVTRFLIENFWAPVGSGVQPRHETRFVAGYLFSSPEGRAAAQKIDDTIRRLPGLRGVPLIGAWLERELPSRRAHPEGEAGPYALPSSGSPLGNRSAQGLRGLSSPGPSVGILR